MNFSDPHEFLHSAEHWTHTGIAKNLHLQVMAILILLDNKDQIVHNFILGKLLIVNRYISFPRMGSTS